MVAAFSEEQALLRRGGKHAAPFALLHDVLVVLLRLEAEQRKPKPALPGDRLRMAAARVAAGLGEDRLRRR